MPYQKMYDLIERLSAMGKNVFTVNDASKLTGKKTLYMSLMLSKNKYIDRIERGKYYLKGTDILEVASNVIFPSYLSLFSAFRYYNLTTQIPLKISVISTLRHKKLTIHGNVIEFRLLDKNRFFGYLKKDGIFIAEIEKAIIDALYFGEPPYSYVLESFQIARDKHLIDIKKLKHYCIMMHSNALISRLGFLLESEGLDASDLYKKRSKRYITIPGISSEKNRWLIK